MAVKFEDLKDAFEFVSFGEMYTHEAYLCRETGKIYYHSEFGDDIEPLPDDLDDERFISIPHKNELDLGKRLVFKFSYKHLGNDVERVEQMFRKKGAYSRFKALLEKRGMTESWYQFEEAAEDEALREWCEFSQIDIEG